MKDSGSIPIYKNGTAKAIISSLAILVTLTIGSTGSYLLGKTDKLEERVSAHEILPAHPVAAAQIKHCQETNDEIKEDIKEIREIVHNIDKKLPN